MSRITFKKNPRHPETVDVIYFNCTMCELIKFDGAYRLKVYTSTPYLSEETLDAISAKLKELNGGTA